MTLMVAGRPLTFTSRIEGCKPPYISKAQPGVCPGSGKAKKAAKGARGIAKAVVGRKKAVAEQKESRAAEKAKKAAEQVDKLGRGEKFDAHPEDMEALMEMLRGDDIPPMNLAKMQVLGDANKNMFQHHLRDIPRKEMPTVPGTVAEMMPLIQELSRRGIKVELVEMDPREIQMVQSELSAAKVAHMTHSMRNGWMPGGATVISRENALGDGHHRFAGAAMAAVLHEQGVPGYKPVKIMALKVDLPVDELLAVLNEHSGERKGLDEKP